MLILCNCLYGSGLLYLFRFIKTNLMSFFLAGFAGLETGRQSNVMSDLLLSNHYFRISNG